MTFEEILPHLRAGKFVWRTSWFVSWSGLQQRLWYETTPGGTKYLASLFESRIHLSAQDLDATDWEVYERKSNDQIRHQDPPTPPSDSNLS